MTHTQTPQTPRTLTPADLDAIADTVRAIVTDLPTKPVAASDAPPDYLTREDAAAFLCTSMHRLWQAEKAGHIRSQRVGRRLLYRRSDLIAALESGDLGRPV